MSVAARLVSVVAASEPFASHHGITIPGAGASLALGTSLARGGFGALHPVTAIDGATPRRGLLAKVFDDDVLAGYGGYDPVIATTRDLHAALVGGGGQSWPDAVRALPYCLAVTEIAGRRALVALMLDLRQLGYGEAPFVDRGRSLAYIRRPAHDRIRLAVQFAKRAALLEAVGLLHGDLNPENVLIDPVTLDAQIIDFDSGVLVVTGAERPRTPDKPGDCVPPEIKGSGAGAIPADARLYTVAAERWSIGSLVGYCLFGCHPGFFLRSISRASIEEYAREPAGWPEIDVDGPLFTTIAANGVAYRRMRTDLQAVPPGTRDLFARFFAAGLVGERRPSAADWVRALEGMLDPPVIEQIGVSDEWVIEGSQVIVTWRARNATHVELTPGGRCTSEGSRAIVVTETTIVSIDAVNAIGSVTASSPVVHVLPMPRIETIAIPGAPDLDGAISLPVAAVLTQAVGGAPAHDGPPALHEFLADGAAAPTAGAHAVVTAYDLVAATSPPVALPPAAPRIEDFFDPAPRSSRSRRRHDKGGRTT